MYVPGGSRVERLHALRRGRDGVRNAASFTRHKTMDGAVTLVACCHAGPKGRGFTMRILLALAAIGCPLFTLNAQDTPLVRPGTRLRVTAESSLLQLPTGTYRVLEDTTLVLSTGLYRQLTGATLVLTHGSATLRFPVASIALVERSHGRWSRNGSAPVPRRRWRSRPVRSISGRPTHKSVRHCGLTGFPRQRGVCRLDSAPMSTSSETRRCHVHLNLDRGCPTTFGRPPLLSLRRALSLHPRSGSA